MKLVYLSPVPWNSVAQRPHFFVKSALEHGFTSVLWIEPTPSRLPKLIDFKTIISSVEADSFPKDSRINLVKPRMIPVEPINSVYKVVNYSSFKKIFNIVANYTDVTDTIFISGKPSILSLFLLKNIKFRHTIADIMDDYPFFFDGIAEKSMSGLLKDVIRHSDKAVFSSSHLLSKYGHSAKECFVINNACDQTFIDNVTEIKKHKDLTKSETKTFGYIGSIAKWFDWKSVIKLANENPHSIVKIIGPNYSLKTPILPKNVLIRPAIEHSKVPLAMQEFDYGLIPFKINPLTDSVDPVKYYEYLSSGIDIISTPFGEMKERVLNLKVYNFDNYNSNIKCKIENVKTWDDRFSCFFNGLKHD